MSFWFMAIHITLPAALWVLGIIAVIFGWLSAQRLRSTLAQRAWTCIDLPSPDRPHTWQRLAIWFGQLNVRRYQYAAVTVLLAVTASVLSAECWHTHFFR